MITISPNKTFASPHPDSAIFFYQTTPCYSHVLPFPFLSSPCNFLLPLPFPFFLLDACIKSYRCVFIIAKVISHQKTETHLTLSQSISSHNPFTSSSMLPEYCRGWHRCLMWDQAYSYHLCSSLWPVMGPSLIIAHCWISIPDGGWERHKSIWINVFRRQVNYVSICPNMSGRICSFWWLFLHLIQILLSHLQIFQTKGLRYVTNQLTFQNLLHNSNYVTQRFMDTRESTTETIWWCLH